MIRQAAESLPVVSRSWAPAACAALLALALYVVTLGGTYIYDDLYLITRDRRVADPRLWGQFWTRDYFNGGVDQLYRPLTSMTYAVQWWVHGDRPWAFHLVNWLLHAGSSALVAELARRMIGLRGAFIAGLLFAAHPVHVEAVAGIVGRAELICNSAILGALILISRQPLTVGRALGIWACTVIALLSKEQGLLLPLLLAAMYGIGYDRAATRQSKSALLLLALLICWTFAGYIILRESFLKFWWDRSFLDWTQNPLIRAQGIDRWLMPVALLGRYVALLIAPVKLSIDYGGAIIGWQMRWDDPYLYIGFVAAGTCAALLAWSVLRRRWSIAFCLFALWISYALVGNFVALIGTNFAERLMYLPSVFFLLLIAMPLARLPRHILMPTMAVLLALASLRTVNYAARWNDRLSFYEISLRAQPRSINLVLLLAEELKRQGKLADAETVLVRGRTLQPDYAEVWVKSADLARALGKHQEADAFFREAVNIDPRIGLR